MKKILLVLTLIGSLSMLTLGQYSGEEFTKVEVFGGFSSSTDLDRYHLQGFSGSVVYNLQQYVGIRAEGTTAFKNYNTTGSIFSRRFANGGIGVQIKNNKPEGRVKPFGHFLVGYGNYTEKTTIKCNGCPTYKSTEKGASITFGGGLDVRVNDRIDIRAIQLDVIRIFSPGIGWGNGRFSSGIIVKF